MKKIVLYVGGGVVLLLSLVLILASFQPSEFVIQRSVGIGASRATIFPLIADLKRFDDWSPYAAMDPQMKKTYEGTPATVGSSYSWDGNSKVGAGKMTISGLVPDDRVDIQLDFLRPMESTNTSSFILKDLENLTELTWVMNGSYKGFSGLIGKTFAMFVDMDKMVGSDFEKGLQKVKTMAEDLALAETDTFEGAMGEAINPANTTITKDEDKGELTIVRIFDAPRTQVWKSWTDAEQVKKWWGPKGYTAPVAKIDFKLGGKYLFAMRAPDGKDFWSTGTYTKIVAEETIENDDSFADENGAVVSPSHYGMPADFPANLQVKLRFETLEPSKTKMTLVHSVLPKGQLMDMTALGWAESFNKLADSLSATN